MPIFSYRGKEPKIGKNVFIAPSATIIGDVTIDDDCSIWHNCVIRGDLNAVRIGKCTNIQDNCTIHTMVGVATEIGSYVTIGHNCVIHCNQIGDNCIIGMGTIVMGLCSIGTNSVIGAGTIVPHNVKLPDKSLIFGSPCRIKRALHHDEIEAIHQAAIRYQKLAVSYQNNVVEMK